MVSQAGRAFRLAEFQRIFSEIRMTNQACAEYLEGIGYENWSRCHFVGNRYNNVMTSNISESLNNVLTSARDFPVISILETIRTTLVTWFALRREAAETEEDRINPKLQEMIIKNFELSAAYMVLKIGDGLYEVREETDVGFAVNLWERSCSCREFQLLGIPCRHAVVAAIREGIRVDSLVDEYYTVEYRRKAFAGIIMHVPDMDSLAPSPEDVAGGKLAPPRVRRPPGRPRKKRFLSRGEFKVILEQVNVLIQVIWTLSAIG